MAREDAEEGSGPAVFQEAVTEMATSPKAGASFRPQAHPSQRSVHTTESLLDISRAAASFKPQPVGSTHLVEHSGIKSRVIPDWSLCNLHEGQPQLTIKALLVGCVMGVLCNFLALYYGLKTGITPSMNILAGLGGFVLMQFITKIGLIKSVFTPQENAVIQTTAVACYSVSCPAFGFASSYLAMSQNAHDILGDMEGNYRTDVVELVFWRNVVWCLALAFFGFFLAFPIRNYTILKQRLLFPSGTATAYVIKSMHKIGDGTKSAFAYLSKFFFISFFVNLFCWSVEGLENFPIFGMMVQEKYGWSFDFDIGSIGIGMILAPMTNVSMLLGCILGYAVLSPLLLIYKSGPAKDDWFDEDNQPGGSHYLGTYAYLLFSGLGIMIIQGLYSIGVLIYTLVQEHKKKKRPIDEDEGDAAKEEIEILDEIFLKSRFPSWVPIVGYLISCVMLVVIFHFLFKVHWYQTIVALLLAPLFAFTNIQGLGRTDWDLASSYGKVMMFPFGAWNMGTSILPSLALCVTTISGASNAATLLQDFKTGYLLGADPNSMFLAQIFGTLWGCIVTPAMFSLLTSTYKLPNTDPGAFVQGRYGGIYRTLAVVATGAGFSSLPKNCLWIAFGFCLLAVLLNILELVLPPKFAKYVPDASSLSTGLLVGVNAPVDFMIGGLVCMWWSWWDPVEAHEKSNYVASGCMAGSGIGTVVRCLLTLAGCSPLLYANFRHFPVDEASPEQPPVKYFSASAWAVFVILAVFACAIFCCGMFYWFTEKESPMDRKRRRDAKRNMKMLENRIEAEEAEDEETIGKQL